MKRYLLPVLMLLVASSSIAQNKIPYRVVFDITSNDTNVHKAIIRTVEGIRKDVPDANLEIVFYGQSLEMITNGKSVVADKVKDLAAKKEVEFKVCQVAMKRQNVEPSQLLTGVQTVPDGIYEIITKQSEGWGYIKVAK
ncbi:MAG: DsrE family protein [Bacteroidota bacterium]